jgi:hypothetical protein
MKRESNHLLTLGRKKKQPLLFALQLFFIPPIIVLRNLMKGLSAYGLFYQILAHTIGFFALILVCLFKILDYKRRYGYVIDVLFFALFISQQLCVYGATMVAALFSREGMATKSARRQFQSFSEFEQNLLSYELQEELTVHLLREFCFGTCS